MTLRTNANWLDTLICLVVAVLTSMGAQSPAAGIISGLLCAVVIGVWRVVRFLGVLVQLKQSEVQGESDQSRP